MQPIHIEQLSKHFGQTVAVDGVDLAIEAGDLFFLLGPSGCGKTTLLRMLAGFIDPTAGRIFFGQREVTHLPPNRRNTGMVFQGYALWPHMTVAQNVAFGLDVRRVGKAEKQRRVDEALSMVQMHELAHRRPNALSGGQQQRVALARALVIEPTVLLLDEPLSNLDAKLRGQMRSQIRSICKQAGITAVYVTHDQKEALSMADRIAVMQAGQVRQSGTPLELYTRPRERFVADFLGQANFITARVRAREPEGLVLETPLGTLVAGAFTEAPAEGAQVTCCMRPETLRLHRNGQAQGEGSPNRFEGRVIDLTYLGEQAEYHIRAGEDQILLAAELNPRQLSHENETLQLSVDPEDVVVLKD